MGCIRVVSRFICALCFLLTASRSATAISIPNDVCPPKQTGLFHHFVRQGCSTVVDEDSRSRKWFPWTHRPSCVEGITEHGEYVDFCVYTSSFFGNHGVSIVTRPDIAARGVSIVEDVYHSAFPSKETVLNLGAEGAYEIVNMPGKGKGVIAKRKIRKHETFMIDFASIVLENDFTKAVSVWDKRRLLKLAADQLADSEAVIGLAQSGLYGEDRVEDVMNTNEFNSEFVGVPHKVLLPIVSRMNHACRPSAYIRPSLDGLTAGVAAFRDLEPGDEITISYIPIHQTHEQRQTRLLERWGFTCECSMCNAPIAEILESDGKRDLVIETKDLVLAALQEQKMYVAIKHLEELLDHLAEEYLVPLLHEPYDTLARIYWLLGDKEKAEDYLHMRLDIMEDYVWLAPRNRTADVEEALESFGMSGRGSA